MPSPTSTAKTHRLFAWPRYDRPQDLQSLAQMFGPLLANRPDASLSLRHDSALDPPIADAAKALEAALVAALGADADMDVLLVDEDLDDAGWRALADSTTAVLQLPSSLEPRRRHRLAMLGRPVLVTADDLRRQLGGGTAPSLASPPAPAVTRTPTVTAIISTYQSAQFMRGCLEDLTAQTLYAKGLLEIIVIDSGSPENEGEIVRDVQRLHPGIRYLRTERETLYAAWNRAVLMARGSYLTNANTDDRHRPDALEVLAAELDRDAGVAVVYADQLVTRQPNETFARNSAHARFNWPSYSWAELQQRCMIGPQPMWRRALHDRWGLFDDKFHVAGDYEFWMRIGRAETFRRVPEVLGLYFQNGAGLEWTSGQRTATETIDIKERYASAPTAPTATKVAAPATTGPAAPLVSVIMPTYNRPDFLLRALGSLTEQTFTDFEVVVVNDAGDPMETLLDRFAGKLRITYLRNGSNRDRAAARNAGILLARGKYLAYLDDDDVYLPEHLAVLVAALRDGQRKVAFTEAVLISEQKTNGHYTAGNQIMRMALPFSPDRLLVYNDIPILCLMHEKACLDEVGKFDESLGTHEDWDLLIRLAHRHDFVQVRQLTAAISWREDGSSTTSGRRDDFRRTLTLIHDRYRHLAAGKPQVLEMQAQARSGIIVPAAPSSSASKAAFSSPVERAHDLMSQAQAMVVRGQVGQARETLAAGVELAQHAPELVVALADVFATEGKVDTACELLQQITLLHPSHHAAADRRVAILAEASARSTAQRAAQRAFAAY